MPREETPLRVFAANTDAVDKPERDAGDSAQEHADRQLLLPPDKQQLSAVDPLGGSISDSVLEMTDHYVRASRADATRRAYQSDLARFAAWCHARGVSPIPAAAEVVASYLAESADTLKPSTLKRHLASISVAHRAATVPNPAHDELVRSVMAGIRRERGTAPAKKSPIVVGELRTLVRQLGTPLADRRDRALLLVGWCAALRRSEIAALRVRDLDFVADGLVLRVVRSKTDQDGAGREIGVGYGAATDTCPVLAIRVWIERSGIETGCVFRQIDRHNNLRAENLSGRAVAEIIKRRASTLGLDPRRLGGHSLRSGFATSAAQAGVSEAEIAEVTGHRSIAVLRGYVQHGRLFSTDIVQKVGL